MSRLSLKATISNRVACAKLSGQGSVEWMLIVTLIGLVLVAGLVALQGTMDGKIVELGNFIRDV